MNVRRIAAALPLLIVAGAVQAQPALRASTPANGATIGRTADLRLEFDRSIDAKLAKSDLVMTSMPGMHGHHAMRVALKATPTRDGAGLQLTAKAPLPAGGYKLDWQATDRQGAAASGSVAFTIK